MWWRGQAGTVSVQLVSKCFWNLHKRGDCSMAGTLRVSFRSPVFGVLEFGFGAWACRERQSFTSFTIIV